MAAEGGHFEFEKKIFFWKIGPFGPYLMDVLLRRQSEFDWRQIRTVLEAPKAPAGRRV